MATYKIHLTDKQHFLDNSNDGFDFLEHVCGDLKMRDQNNCENILNPFYDDTNPGFHIRKCKVWGFKDYGDPEYEGDVFDFAARYFDLDVKKDFRKLLHLMYEALGIEKPSTSIEIEDDIYERGYLFEKNIHEDEEGLELALEFFKKYQITRKTLKKYAVRAIRHYYFIDKHGEIQKWRYKRNEDVFAYQGLGHVKLYQPEAKEYKFLYRGSKPHDYVFGQSQIASNMVKTKKYRRELLIITGGEKDVMTLDSLGYDAVCFNSETATMPQQFEDSIINGYKRILVLYDIDETGKKQAKALQRKHGFAICTLPEELRDQGGKDVSDYVMLGLDIGELHDMIQGALKKRVTMTKKINDKLGLNIEAGYVNSKGEYLPWDESESSDGEEQAMDAVSEPSIEYVVEEPAESETVEEEPTEGAEDELPQIEVERTPKIDHSYFPNEIFSQLPEILKEICNQFANPRDRDLILLSAMAVMSTVLRTVKSENSGAMIGANLNFLISAPAASGKGVANWGRQLVMAIQLHLREKFQHEMERYKMETRKFQIDSKEDPYLPEPKKPLRESLLIPANNSISKFIEMIGSNKDYGLMFETEGDTLTGSLKNEWGNFSDVIRKCFHHEQISLARRGNDELIEVDHPCLSMFLTGTPDQLISLIEDVENGFFSRFAFYDFETELEWKSQFGKRDTPFQEFFESKAKEVLKIWLTHENAENTEVIIQDHQAQKVNEYFTSKQIELAEAFGADIVASVKRACVILQRLAMILTSLRWLESNPNLPAKMPMNDADVSIALKMVDVMLEHLKRVFSRMKGTINRHTLSMEQRKVWDALPAEFTREEYNETVVEVSIKLKTGEKYLNDFIKKRLLMRVKHGFYRKEE
jgi:5S rRNA maturation endonuclease (ribonuclease M5)